MDSRAFIQIVVDAAIAVLIGFVAYLLKAKDERQQKDIEAIGNSLDADREKTEGQVRRLDDTIGNLRVQIASDHYTKTEVAGLIQTVTLQIQSIQTDMREQFKHIERKIDRMFDTRKGDE